MKHISRKISQPIALSLLIGLLLPLFAGAIFATPAMEEVPVWSGGAAESFVGSGTQAQPYQINTPEELALLAQRVRSGEGYAGKYFQLTQDIRLNDTADYAQWATNPPLRSWTPIGGYTACTVESAADFEGAIAQYGGLFIRTDDGYQPATTYIARTFYYRLCTFQGILDGNGYSISGLYIPKGEQQAGLFSVLDGAVIQNLKITSAYVRGNQQAGVLAGAILSKRTVQIRQISVDAVVTGEDCLGGVVGLAQANETGKITISQCTFTGTLNGKTNTGGILGKTDAGSGSVTLTSCTSRGYVTATQDSGGIVGHLTGMADELQSCKNYSSIQGDRSIGGIVGTVAPASGTATIRDCQNAGVLLTEGVDGMSGGIAGSALATNDQCSIALLACRNIGDVCGTVSTGGILGSGQLTATDSVLLLQNCKNSAPVQGRLSVGGIAGNGQVESGTLTIDACENYGAVTASEDCAGGIIGDCSSSSQVNIHHSSVRAAVQAKTSFAGGIAGKLTAQSGSILLELSGAAGSVSAYSAVGGMVGELASFSRDASVQVENCLAMNTLSATESLGGIAGHLYAHNGTASVITSIFGGGIVSGSKLTGGIVANVYAKESTATAFLQTCFFSQNAATVAAHLQGGDGKEQILSTESRTEEALRTSDQLTGLDFNIWKSNSQGKHPLVPGEIPLVWEEYQYTVTQNGAILVAYLGRSDLVRVPERLGGVVVSTIVEEAFWHSEVIRVILPDHITAIGEAAFAGCQKLERITLPSSLISIGARAFSECESLSELRCTSLLSTVLLGSENEPFQALSITRPLTLQINHLYEDGSIAGKSTTLTCYVGDFYQVETISITGYEADKQALRGICQSAERISVIYRIGTYHLTIRYLTPDGNEVFTSFEGDFRYGDLYSIPSPLLDGFQAEHTLVEGIMEGNDMLIVVHYTEIFENDTSTGQQTLQIVLLILFGLVAVCCLCYFIYRYRFVTEQARSENEI